MYTIQFKNLCEIRMGSPYNIADIELKGDFIPELNQFQFQDKYAISSSATKCILVQWDTENNQPGFILWCLDEDSKTVTKTKKIEGCCDNINIIDNKIVVKIWSWDPKNKVGITTCEEIGGII